MATGIEAITISALYLSPLAEGIDVLTFENIRLLILWGIIQGIGWFIQKVWNSKKDKAEIKETEADTEKKKSESDSMDFSTIAGLFAQVEKLREKQVEDFDAGILRDKEIRKLKTENEEIRADSEELTRVGEERKVEIIAIQKENRILRELIADEQLNSQIMRQGVRKLISQLVDLGITPEFELPEKSK